MLSYFLFYFIDRLREFKAQFLALLVSVVLIDVLNHVVVIDSEEFAGVLEVHIKLVLENVVVLPPFFVHLVDLVDLCLHVVWYFWDVFDVARDFALPVNEHVGVSRGTTKHFLQSTWHYWLHSAIVEVKPVLAELNVGVGHWEVAKGVVQVLLFLLFLLLLALFIVVLILLLVLVLLSFELLSHGLPLFLTERVPIDLILFDLFLLVLLFL